MATEGTAVRAGSWTSAQALLERMLRDSVVPQSRASLPGPYATQSKRPMKSALVCSRE
jgi:hypothetical protein